MQCFICQAGTSFSYIIEEDFRIEEVKDVYLPLTVIYIVWPTVDCVAPRGQGSAAVTPNTSICVGSVKISEGASVTLLGIFSIVNA